MTTSTFDTLAAARDLEAAGVERPQAEAHAAALRTAIESTRSDLATKADMHSAIAALENRLVEGEIRLVKRGIGLALGVAGLTAAVVLAGVRLMLATGAG